MNHDRGALKRAVTAARHLVVFTGAGISAESGIPTYRGDDGIWNKYDPDKFANVNYFFKDPAYYWNFFKEVRYPVISKAKPNPAHRVLAHLEEKGILKAVITQNIDGLHQLGGSRKVLELHGNTRRITCLNCGSQYTMEAVFGQLETRLPPLCTQCGGTLKPEVVFFGESLPSEVLDEAVRQSRACDLFLVIGSSLVVQPAAALPALAKEDGADLIIINKDPTPLDRIAEMVFREPAAMVMQNLLP
jgi:NAD-dependent deacetylase